MEYILTLVSEPGVIVSIICSIIAAIILKWLELLLHKIQKFPQLARLKLRAVRLRNIKSIRKSRNNPMEITFAIARANAHFLVFILVLIFYFGALIAFQGLRNLVNQSWLTGLLIASPIFAYEVFWLYHDSLANKLVKEYGKILKYREKTNQNNNNLTNKIPHKKNNALFQRI